MNLNWLGVFSAVLAFVFFFFTYRATREISVKKRILFVALALVAAIPGASFAAYYAHVLPEPSWYYQFRSIWGTEFLMVFVGIAGGLVATLVHPVLRVLPLLGVAVLSAAPVIKPVIGPISTSAFRDEWDGNVCLQSTSSSCGLASTATILKQFGVNVTELELVAEAHSYARGTEAWYLARAVRARGLDVKFVFSAGFPQGDLLPAVVGVRFGTIGHFIAMLGRDGDKFLIGDPLRGRESLSQEELLRRYDFTGFHMCIRIQSGNL